MRLKSFAALSALTLVFVGCGDDITEKTENYTTNFFSTY